MLTARGWRFLLASFLLAVVSVTSAWSPTVAILAVTLLAWIIVEWIIFALRCRFALPHLVAERAVMQLGRSVTSGWAGLPFEVRFTVRNRSRFRCPYVHLLDLGPPPELLADGAAQTVLALPVDAEGEVRYTLKPTQPGILHFAGVRVRMHDLNGFFRAEHFLPAITRLTVLPALTDDEGRQRGDKRFNALPPPGTHRLRMPGSGSELLDLREYRPGDPPKMIAWKASARRDRLITKEFESEVPVRCVLFLDAANTTRLGAGENTPLARLATTAAGILLAATANRDLVGLTTFDASNSQSVAPARSSSHATQLLGDLARTAALLPEVPESDPGRLLARLEPALRERKPELFDAASNTLPWGLFWRPLLDTRLGWLIFLPYLFAPLLAIQSFWLDLAARAARSANPNSGNIILDLPAFLAMFALVLALPSTLATLFWLAFGLSGFLPGTRRQTRLRKQLGAVFATIDGDSAAAIERYLQDDIVFAARAGRFFAAEQIRITPRRFGSDGQDRFREPQKIAVLAEAIVRATTRARDNELYVLLVDILDLADSLAPLLRAIRLARVRHHSVLVIILWPTDVPMERPSYDAKRSRSLRVAVERAVEQGVWRRYDKMRRSVTRAGGMLLRLTDRDTVRTVLDHLDRLRGARSRR